jgi:Ca2+-binding EF-hand superfamily protein
MIFSDQLHLVNLKNIIYKINTSFSKGLKQPDGYELDKFHRYDPRVDSWDKLEKFHTYLNSDEISIFEHIGGKQCLITFSDYIFLVTLLSTPRRYFQIAFQMFDFDGNGNFDFDEFTKLKGLIRAQTSIGQRHRDHSTTGNILRETSIVNQYFFGENLDRLLTIDKFLEFYEQLQREILQLEFHRSTKCPMDKTRMTELDFAASLLAYSGLAEKRVKKMLKRIKKSYPIDDKTKSIGITFNDYQNFYNFLRNIHDIDVALTFYHIAGGAIDKQIFHHVAKTVNHIELDSHLVDVVFTLFDENEDQLLSYVEFIHLMKTRLERGLQRPKDTAFMKLFSSMITCAKETYL